MTVFFCSTWANFQLAESAADPQKSFLCSCGLTKCDSVVDQSVNEWENAHDIPCCHTCANPPLADARFHLLSACYRILIAICSVETSWCVCDHCCVVPATVAAILGQPAVGSKILFWPRTVPNFVPSSSLFHFVFAGEDEGDKPHKY